MNRWFSITLSGFLLLAAATMAAAQTVNVTGVWTVTLKTPRGEFILKAIIKQEGEKLSGVVTGPRGVRSEPVQGTIKGAEVKVTCAFDDSGNTILITLIGEVSGDAMKGKADFGGFFEGDWAAKRLAEAAPAEASPPPANNALASERVDVSGLWVFEVETATGSSSPTFLFKQDGETLTGQFKGAFADAPLAGTVTGNELKFSYKVQTQGGELTVTYAGTIEKGLMKGAVQFGSQDSGKWTAKRK
jgi:hypothetical protein